MTERKSTGVTYLKNKKLWYARITFYGVRYSLGTHKNYEKAVEIYKAAQRAGCVEVKAWCNTPVEYRGKLGEKLVGISKYQEEENKIKQFPSIQDCNDNEENHLIW
jgi:hypothetical protein